MTLRPAIAILMLVAMGLSAAAAPIAVPPDTVVTAPEWQTGSAWYYSDGYGVKVSSSANGVAVFERLDAPGQWFSRQGFLRKDLVSGTATRNSIYRTLPDSSGNSLSARAPLTFEREYLSNGKLLVHASSWTLEGRETITVPAGTFDCYVIVWRTRSLKSDWTGFERWWYSPAAQNYVRLEYKYGPAEASSRVLMRYNLGQRAAELPAPPQALALNMPAPENIEQQPLPPTTAEPAPAVEMPSPAPIAALQAARAPVPTAITTQQTATGGEYVWRVQLASSKDPQALRAELDKILARHAKRFEGLPSGIATAQVAGRGIFHRAWVGNFASNREAEKLCVALKADGRVCTVMRASAEAEAAG